MIEQIFAESFQDAAARLEQFRGDAQALGALAQIARRLQRIFEKGGKVLIAGNGGSMADAIHFAEEWTGRFRSDRRPFPALALADAAHLSCVANDYGFEQVFSRMVQAFASPDDMLILLSTSGNSPNLLRAAEAGRATGCHIVGFLGRDGGKLRALCDTVVMAPGETSDRIQELHMLALHTLIEAVECALEQPNA
jgi:D-sedoheptulose 7-phosphate isomerase